MKPEQRDEQAELERMIAEVCKERGIKPLVDPDELPPLEDFPMKEPSKEERAARRELHRIAKEALVLSKDSSPLCKSALKTLAAFAAGKAGYIDLALARQRLSNRTTSAGAIGLRHRAPNAAATIACFHACHPDIKEAEQLTRQFCAMTAEFANDPGRIRPELAKPSPPVKRVSPNNIRATLKLCRPEAQAIFNRLMDAWTCAGGVVQGKRIGRIYLKLQTKAHRSGNSGRLPHNFNLLVLASPKGKIPAHVEAAWGLSRSEWARYLDCIPEAVENYERIVMALPGFDRKGTISRVFLHTGFTPANAETLVNTMLALKAAEKSAP